MQCGLLGPIPALEHPGTGEEKTGETAGTCAISGCLSPARETPRYKGSQLGKNTVFSKGSELLREGSYPGMPTSDCSPPHAPWLLVACGDPSGLFLNL